MPTYDYRCKACKHVFEHFQSMSSDLLRKCPKCAKLKLERLIGPGGGLLFKGSGFYITDYRSSSYQDAAKKDVPAPATPAASTTPAPASGTAATPAATPAPAATKERGSKGSSSPTSAPSGRRGRSGK